MSKLIVLVLAVLFVAMMVSAQKCSPWKGPCTQYSDCCRHLECLFYANKCVPKYGLRVPGVDKRPVGPGPYPPFMGRR